MHAPFILVQIDNDIFYIQMNPFLGTPSKELGD